MAKLTLDELVAFVSTHSIEEAYDRLGYDYFSEANRSNTNKQEFLDALAWRDPPPPPPSSEVIRRLFNQINSSYAEQWALQNPDALPSTAIETMNHRALFRQGKHVGPRRGRITFGLRVFLDFKDPLRQFPWLHGIAPDLIEAALEQWCLTVVTCPKDVDTALALSMILVAIHPYSDGNGRVGRLVFTWLCQRWGLPVLWLAEAGDGELMRTGQGIESTEFLMATFMLELATRYIEGRPKRYNLVDSGRDLRSSDEIEHDDRQMLDLISQKLAILGEGNTELVKSPEFKALNKHLREHSHLRKTSPRFECLRDDLL